MKLGLVVNNINTECSYYTTTQIAMTATNMGHEVWYISLTQLTYNVDECLIATVRQAPRHRYHSIDVFLRALKGQEAVTERIKLEDLDVLWLRNDPADDAIIRPWAKHAGINFGRLAKRRGVLVINDPDGLAVASNKMYLQYFPAKVRPETVISRDPETIKAFIHDQGGLAVLKPLSGSGGWLVGSIHRRGNTHRSAPGPAHRTVSRTPRTGLASFSGFRVTRSVPAWSAGAGNPPA